MDSQALAQRLAVCSWSLQPASPQELLSAIRELEIPAVQLALDPLRDQPDVWGQTANLFAAAGVAIVSGMFGTIGEDYSTLESIKRTGGIVPDEHWAENWANIQKTADLAASLQLKLVTFHAGFLPHEPTDPDYGKLADRIRRVAGLFAERGIRLGFETGQETATTLSAFLTSLDCPHVGVNFDPANMLLYDKGDPIAALRELTPWLQQCHIKDARRTRTPGTWGEEVVVGTGEVDWATFFQVLETAGFEGALCIEREAGTQRLPDIRTARDAVLRIAGNAGAPNPE